MEAVEIMEVTEVVDDLMITVEVTAAAAAVEEQEETDTMAETEEDSKETETDLEVTTGMVVMITGIPDQEDREAQETLVPEAVITSAAEDMEVVLAAMVDHNINETCFSRLVSLKLVFFIDFELTGIV
jgi:hypothetical protein